MSRRADIIMAAKEEFAEKGFVRTSYATIGERVGMHRNALQHYLPSKPELAAQIAWEPFKNGQFLAPSDHVTGGVETIFELVQHVGTLYVTDVGARASMRLMEEKTLIPAELPTPFYSWVTPIRTLLDEAVTAGDVRPETDTRDLAWRIVASFAGTRLMAEVLDELHVLPERAGQTARDLVRAHAPR